MSLALTGVALLSAVPAATATHEFSLEAGDRGVAAVNVSGYNVCGYNSGYVMTSPYMIVTVYLLGAPILAAGELGYEYCCPEESTFTVLWFHFLKPGHNAGTECKVH